jgi:hypothetical protein
MIPFRGPRGAASIPDHRGPLRSRVLPRAWFPVLQSVEKQARLPRTRHLGLFELRGDLQQPARSLRPRAPTASRSSPPQSRARRTAWTVGRSLRWSKSDRHRAQERVPYGPEHVTTPRHITLLSWPDTTRMIADQGDGVASVSTAVVHDGAATPTIHDGEAAHRPARVRRPPSPRSMSRRARARAAPRRTWGGPAGSSGRRRPEAGSPGRCDRAAPRASAPELGQVGAGPRMPPSTSPLPCGGIRILGESRRRRQRKPRALRCEAPQTPYDDGR